MDFLKAFSLSVLLYKVFYRWQDNLRHSSSCSKASVVGIDRCQCATKSLEKGVLHGNTHEY